MGDICYSFARKTPKESLGISIVNMQNNYPCTIYKGHDDYITTITVGAQYCIILVALGQTHHFGKIVVKVGTKCYTKNICHEKQLDIISPPELGELYAFEYDERLALGDEESNIIKISAETFDQESQIIEIIDEFTIKLGFIGQLNDRSTFKRLLSDANKEIDGLEEQKNSLENAHTEMVIRRDKAFAEWNLANQEIKNNEKIKEKIVTRLELIRKFMK